jgi:putative transposase
MLESERTQALERFYVIRPFLKDGVPLAQIARERAIPLRTLSRWVKRYREIGLGYFLGFSAPTALQTALTLHQAIWRKDDPRWHICGIPRVFYTDHGSDFASRQMEQVAADLKIERFFQTVEQLLLPDLPGYTPEGQPPAPAVWSLPAFEEVFRTWLLDEYLQRRQKEIGAAPQARWEASSFLPQMPDSLERLVLLLLQVAKARRVHQDGIYFEG